MKDRSDCVEGPERLDKQEAKSYSFKTVQCLLQRENRTQGRCYPPRYLMRTVAP